MAFKAATAKVAVPADGARLLKLLRGQESASESLGLGGKFARGLVLKLLNTAGFTRNYFHGEFLAGASGAIQHISADALPKAASAVAFASSARRSFDSCKPPKESMLEPKLHLSWVKALGSLHEAGLELTWNVEEVTKMELGDVSLVYGMRRSRGLPDNKTGGSGGSFRSMYAGHTVVMHGEHRSATSWDWLAASQEGVTVSAEALLTCRQTVMLRRRDGGDVLAGHFEEAALIRLRLETELISEASASAPTPGLPGGSPDPRLRWDEDRGWTVSDLNHGLSGNCAAAHFPLVE